MLTSPYPLKLQATWGSSHLLQTCFAHVTKKNEKSLVFLRGKSLLGFFHGSKVLEIRLVSFPGAGKVCGLGALIKGSSHSARPLTQTKDQHLPGLTLTGLVLRAHFGVGFPKANRH